MKRSIACLLFKARLLDIYKEKGIIEAFFTYLGFLSHFTKNKKYVEFTSWQIDDMVMCLYNKNINVALEALENRLMKGGVKGKGKTRKTNPKRKEVKKHGKSLSKR